MITVTSFQDFYTAMNGKEKFWLFLYKSGSESSECALSNIKVASEAVKGINILGADVSEVKDIHSRYNLNSVPVLLEFRKGELINMIKGCNDSGHYKALFENKFFRAERRDGEKNHLKVTVYSTPSCSWCNTLKSYLRKNNVSFTDIDLSRDHKAVEILIRRSGQQGVPQTDINGEIVVGFNKQRIDELLGLKA